MSGNAHVRFGGMGRGNGLVERTAPRPGPTPLAPLSGPEARDLLEVIDERTLVKSTLAASQLPIENWHGAIGDPTLADAILDRLIHNAHQIQLKGETMRKMKAPTRTPVRGERD